VAVEGSREINYFNVVVVGNNAEACDLLDKGNKIAIDGQLARYVRENGSDFHECVFIEARSIRTIETQGDPQPLEVRDGKQVNFEDLPPEVQTLICERIAELTEQGL
jgi:single-stranded DNA-binding protein